MLDDVRDRFPGVNDGWARFDGPAGTQMLDAAVAAMVDWMTSGKNANSHGEFAAAHATDAMEAAARVTVGRFLGADAGGIAFGPSATGMMFRLTRAIAATLSPGDEIVCTQLDHDANVSPWLRAAQESGATVRFLELDPATGRLRMEQLPSLLGARTRWVACTGASNALGTRPDLPAVVEAAHAVGARVLVDGVHLAPHAPVDVTALDVDALVTSPYKWYGPHAGVLYLKPELVESLPAAKVRPAPDHGPDRFEQGTPAYEAIAGTVAAAEWLMDQGMDRIEAHEGEVFAPLLDGLLAMDHVTVHGPREHTDRTPTVCFSVAGRHADDVARALAAERIAVWSGNYYALEAFEALGLHEGAVRAGVVRYITPEDVDRLLAAVAALA